MHDFSIWREVPLLYCMDTWVYRIPVFVSSPSGHLRCLPLSGTVESQYGFVIGLGNHQTLHFTIEKTEAPRGEAMCPRSEDILVRVQQKNKPVGYKRYTLRNWLTSVQRLWSPSICKQETRESWQSVILSEAEGLRTGGWNEIPSPAQSRTWVNSSWGAQT